MNLIDPIKHQLACINPDIPSWRLQVKTTKHLCSTIHAYNETEYKGRFGDRQVRFYLQYNIDHITYDINFVKIVFCQPGIKNHKLRNRLTYEMTEKLKLNESPKTHTTNVQQELEKAARMILNASKAI